MCERVFKELTENGAENLFSARSGRKRPENMFSQYLTHGIPQADLR